MGVTAQQLEAIAVSDHDCPGIHKPEHNEHAMKELERSLAYEFCLSVLDSNCLRTPQLAGVVYDLDSATDDRQVCEDAFRYLSWRGLLEHPSGNKSLFVIRDESEGQ